MDSMQQCIIGASLAIAEGDTASAATASAETEYRSSNIVKPPHPLQERETLLSCVRFLEVSKFGNLASPLPKAQDLPAECFRMPSSGDQVVSVSHAWRNQAHPDPTSRKSKLLSELLSGLSSEAVGAGGDEPQPLLLFLDFISIPQRPFRAGQQDRTEEEKITFKKALEVMHEVYFHSDRIIHLPWEDADVPGEGVEETFPASELQDCAFSKIGDCVQVASFPEIIRASKGRTSKGRTSKGRTSFKKQLRSHLFDQVVSVDGHPITSIDQLESLLANNAKNVRLRHFPFGRYSDIPADVRGWVFLERFITMVKCAMMDEDTAENVVITPSEAIFQQIMSGASRLREASVQEARYQKRGELKNVLESFQAELRSKQFAPASTDKRELTRETTLADDREVVCNIMHYFVEHLAEHWEAEAVKQRSFAGKLTRVVAMSKTYLLEWDCFSEDYAAKLAAASTANPWPIAVLATVPLALTLAFLVFPYASPDEGWAAQASFWAFGWPFAALLVSTGFPTFLYNVANVVPTRSSIVFSAAWAVGVSALCVGVGMSIAHVIDNFPVPMSLAIVAVVLSTCAPLLCWCIPKDQLASSHVRQRLLYTIITMFIMAGLHGMAVPLLNAAISAVSEGWQFLLILGYLLVKLGFEAIGIKLSKTLGADVMPYFVNWASVAYQVNLCVAFSKVSSWVVVAEQMCFDVLENFYYLYCIFRSEGEARREQYIVASLVLREFIEVLVPASFLVMYAVLKPYAPEKSVLLCDREAEEVRQTERFLLADLAVEIFVSCVTYLILLHRKHRPLLLLRGVIATRLFPLVVGALASFAYYCAMQHSHWGMDLSFQFRWLADRDSVWECGLTWRNPPSA